MEGNGPRVSAAVLHARDLVRTAGRGDRWRAEITDRGRAYLANPAGRRRRGHGPPAGPRRGAGISVGLSTEEGSLSSPAALSRTEQLVADVVAAGGVLTLPDESASGGVNSHQRAYAAQRHGKVPEGKHLTVARNSEEFVISLEDGAKATSSAPSRSLCRCELRDITAWRRCP
jgi:hypothetical protein